MQLNEYKIKKEILILKKYKLFNKFDKLKDFSFGI